MKRLAIVLIILVGVMLFLRGQVNKMSQAGSFHDEEQQATSTFGQSKKSTKVTWDDAKKATAPIVTTKSGLKYVDIKVGTGDSPTSDADTLCVNYAGFLTEGFKFDASFEDDIKEHKAAVLNLQQLIPGFREGAMGMKVGGRRKLIIPSKLGYGHKRSHVIPPDSTLIFIVDLLDVDHAKKE